MNLYVPTTFSDSYIKKINTLNDLSPGSKIDETYGSLPASPLGSARPRINLPQIGIETLASHIELLNAAGVKFSYLLNAPYSGNLDPTVNKDVSRFIDDVVSILESYDNSVTISSREMFKYIKQRYKLRTIISLVVNIKNEDDIKYFINAGADKIVLSTTRNRHFNFLRDCRKNITDKIILMANESCLFNCSTRFEHFSFAGKDSSTSNMFKNEFRDKYMLACTKAKLFNPANLIKSSWIRPEDISLYEAIGVDNIKLADRTKPEDWLIKCYRSYLTRESPSNYFNLLAMTPMNLSDFNILQFPKIHIDNKSLNHFIDFFYNNDIDCLNRKCEDCKYCDQYANKAISINNNELSFYLNELENILKREVVVI